ncbi:ferric reductase family protein [Aspergillus lucknowensis]|uniref:ferric-chelate reductase (NADPH) n=1 Tax=Aspergillus lucknowensis TaxID=176173 RepID=A0ABR4LEB0_9EURO
MKVDHKHDHRDNSQDLYYQQVDTDFAHYALLAIACFATLLLVWRALFSLSCYLRQVACLTNDRQQFFVPASKWLAAARMHFLYAPLFRTRHYCEFRLSRAINMGTLPSRSQSCIVLGILAMNVALCTVNVPYGTDLAAAVVRRRTGTMATMNLIPVVLMAGRNNPLICLLRISYDTCNLFHRWLARIVVLESFAHVFAWCIPEARHGGWDAVRVAFKGSWFLQTGLIAASSFVFLLVHSPSPIRHAFYETFLHLHIAVVTVAFIFGWIHVEGHAAHKLLLAAIILWGVERAARIATILYRNGSRVPTTAVIEYLPNDLLKVALHIPRPWHITPGQHLYLYIPSISLWTSHPFSVCWSENWELLDTCDTTPDADTEKSNNEKRQRDTIYILIRRRTGFTETLARRVRRSVNQTLSVHAIVEGPYGGIHSLDSYGTVILFAGGVGITHHLLYLQRLVRGQVDGTVATKRITLVWAVRSLGDVECVEDWIDSTLRIGTAEEEEEEESTSRRKRSARVLQILIYVTGVCDSRDERSSHIGLDQGERQVFHGRPSFEKVLAWEVENQIGAMGVLCCGPGGFSDDVRRVCREAQRRSRIDFFEESFTW